MAGKYLDDSGIVELWKKVKNRSIPVKSLTQNEYDQLSEEDKTKDVLYIVDEPDWEPTRLEIQEYDTTVDGCDWHVIKYSNGRCELYGSVEYKNLTINNTWGDGYISSLIGQKTFPLILKKKYLENNSICVSTSLSVNLLVSGHTDPLIKSAALNLFRLISSNDKNVLYTLYIYVSGVWK